jgi:hypothetical protein
MLFQAVDQPGKAGYFPGGVTLMNQAFPGSFINYGDGFFQDCSGLLRIFSFNGQPDILDAGSHVSAKMPVSRSALLVLPYSLYGGFMCRQVFFTSLSNSLRT